MAATGIRKRHSKGCPAKADKGKRCRCGAGYEAEAFDRRTGKKLRKSFPREGEAKTWRAEVQGEVARGRLKASKPTTLQEAWDEWLPAAKAGTIRNRSGKKFKPAALRTYDQSMRLRVLPVFGTTKLADINLPMLQGFVEGMIADELAASTIQVTMLPVRAIYKREKRRGELLVDPCAGLELPPIDSRRERFATATEAEALIAAAPEQDQACWATAFLAGLRRGELRALRWADVDLGAGLIHVRNGWDDIEGEIELKSDAGRRRVPVTGKLRQHLLDHKMRTDRTEGFVFGSTGTSPFDPPKMQKRADDAWEAAGLERVTPHACRHSYASLMIAALSASPQGFNPEALRTFMGHANISITFDRYGHLMPGSEKEAADLLTAYMDAQRERAEDAARQADAGETGAQSGAQSSELAL